MKLQLIPVPQSRNAYQLLVEGAEKTDFAFLDLARIPDGLSLEVLGGAYMLEPGCRLAVRAWAGDDYLHGSVDCLATGLVYRGDVEANLQDADISMIPFGLHIIQDNDVTSERKA